MRRKVIKLVFVGHVDHGKSTLIGRTLYETNSLPKEKFDEVKQVSAELGKDAELAYLTDYLQEERERNITIDTTQIYFKTRKNEYVIIDAPGHVQFIKNMLSGASQAEAAVLIVDAHEGVKEQTRRHAYLIHMLGIKSIIVAVNKMDLLDYCSDRFQLVEHDVTDFLNQLSLHPLHVIPVSARLGENITKRSAEMGWYRGPVFTDALDHIKPNRQWENNPLRFPVQDVLSVKEREIIVGRVEAGDIQQHQKVIVLPDGYETSVLDILRYGEKRKGARSGESIGIVLEDHDAVHRGSVLIGQRDRPVTTDEIRVILFWMSDEPLSIGSDLSIQCSTQEIFCQPLKIEQRIDSSTLKLLEDDARTVQQNEVGRIILKLQKPAVFEPFSEIPELGRFVLRKGDTVKGAGIVSARSTQS